MKYILSLLLMLNFGFLKAQKPQSPVNWEFEIKKSEGSTIEIIATAQMKTPWVIYSQFTDDNGPIPTSFLVNGETVKFDELSKSKTEYDELFEVNVTKFSEKAVFTKKLEKGTLSDWNIEVEFMTCDGERCLPPAIVSKNLKI